MYSSLTHLNETTSIVQGGSPSPTLCPSINKTVDHSFGIESSNLGVTGTRSNKLLKIPPTTAPAIPPIKGEIGRLFDNAAPIVANDADDARLWLPVWE